MKQKTKTTKPDFLLELKNKPAQEILPHILSPIELAAIRKNYRPFKYRLNGFSIYVTDIACKQLLSITRYKVGFFTGVMYRETLTHNNSFHVKRVLEDPRPILNLPSYLRNRLIALQCYNLFDIIQLGRNKIAQSPGFGKSTMKELDDMFKAYECSHLFN